MSQPTEDLPLTFTTSAGLTYVNRSAANLKAINVPDATILPFYAAKLKTRVDADAERLRAALITPGYGQVMEYQEAVSQAQSALASSSNATPAEYPMLAATIGLDIDPTTKAAATDVLGVARAIVAAYAAWVAYGAAIKAARTRGKAAIDAATTVTAATAAYNAIVWPPKPS